MKWDVSHNDRDIEFIEMKNRVEYFLRTNFTCHLYPYKKITMPDFGAHSCESLAELLLKKFDACYVRVMEDNENGAELEV